MLALGVGAGLHPNEIVELPRANIEFTSRGTTIHVTGKNSRSIPLLHEWEEYVDVHPAHEYAIASAATNRTTRILTDFIKASSGVQLKPTPQRLRATWVVTHLNASTPLPVLLDAAGLASPFSLNRYLPYASFLGAVDADAALRQAGGNRA
jgi:hypothetical protein